MKLVSVIPVFVFVACSPGLSQTLNPDPKHGGACKDGDQLAVVCRSPYVEGSWCCHSEYECGTGFGGCIVPAPPVIDPIGHHRDADAGYRDAY